MKRSTKIALLACVSLFFNYQLSIINLATAQQPWNYVTLQESALDEAYLIAPPPDLQQAISDAIDGAEVRYNSLYRLTLLRNGLRFDDSLGSFTLDTELASRLLPYLVSHRYWQRRYAHLMEWAFVDTSRAALLLDIDTSDCRYGRYSPITWLGYRYQPSTQWPVVFTVRTNTRKTQHLTLAALQRLAEWGAFATDEQQLAYEHDRDEVHRQQEYEQQRLQRHLDSLSSIGDSYGRHADSIIVAMQRDSATHAEERVLADVQATKQRMNREEIFLMSLRSARSDYMFGLEFNFYNCFKKTVSSIEIAVAPVNAKGQVQRDRFNRDVRTVRCMGPIRPGAPAQYTFDELFWDDRGRIKYMRVTSVTFYFPDGSHKTYNGYEKILKHTLNP